MKAKLIWFVAIASVGVALAGSLIAAEQKHPLAMRQDSEGTVSVSVTPEALSSTSSPWRFAVQFNTHMTPISQDMVTAASLTGKGVEERPTAWDGDPPGGHHRRGVLVFQPIKPMPPTLTLHVRDVGGVADRTFTWKLGG